jgi:hypothetical protein
VTANLLILDASALKSPDCVIAHRKPTGQTGPMLLHHRLRFFGLGFVDQPRNLVVFW